jgi:hypothetical protein
MSKPLVTVPLTEAKAHFVGDKMDLTSRFAALGVRFALHRDRLDVWAENQEAADTAAQSVLFGVEECVEQVLDVARSRALPAPLTRVSHRLSPYGMTRPRGRTRRDGSPRTSQPAPRSSTLPPARSPLSISLSLAICLLIRVVHRHLGLLDRCVWSEMSAM